ncbi:MAG: pknB 12 [Verrucomicrobiales bacterium]|nr:pknB 12 [Verrucomicrobiales bacterium]
MALEGPDSGALKGDLREQNGAGVHFSGKGLHKHASKWAEKVCPWIEKKVR